VLRDGRRSDAGLAGEIQEFVKERLAAYKYPRASTSSTRFRKPDRGKIDRKKLKV